MNMLARIAAMGGSAASSHSYVGTAYINGSGTLNYPSGTTTGDLVIAVNHAFSPSAPSGFTSVFTTGADVNSYKKNVAYKVCAGESSASMPGGTGFGSHLTVLRGPTSVSSSYAWNYVSGGGSNTLTSAATGDIVISLSDRGAGAGYPGLTTTPDASATFAPTYFMDKSGVYLARVSGTSLNYSDYNEGSNGTSGLLLVAI